MTLRHPKRAPCYISVCCILWRVSVIDNNTRSAKQARQSIHWKVTLVWNMQVLPFSYCNLAVRRFQMIENILGDPWAIPRNDVESGTRDIYPT